MIMQRHYQCGFVLYSILVIVILSSMVAVSLLYASKSAETASAAGEQGEQAWLAAMSGINYTVNVLLSFEQGNTDWKDNSELFKDKFIFNDGRDKWYFSVYSWNGSEDSQDSIVYGVKDEAGKLNLKYLPAEVKKSAEGTSLFEALNEETSASGISYEMDDLTGDLLDSYGKDIQENGDIEISDISDSKDVVSTSSLNTETNTITQTQTETSQTNLIPLLIGSSKVPEFEFLDAYIVSQGYNIRVLYGKDLDMNFQTDSGTEAVGAVFQEGVSSFGALGMGLRHWLTTASYDLNTDSLGTQRINLNDTNASLNSLNLSPETLAYIEAMRRNQRQIRNPAQLLSATEELQDESGNLRKYTVELTESEMAIIFDKCTTIPELYLPGLININTASKEVLEVLPGVSEEIAESIVSSRESLMSDQLNTPAWLLEMNLLTREELQNIYPYITARSRQYYFNIVAYSLPTGRYRVLEVIVDTASTPAQILMIRDLTRLGMPFKIENNGEAESSSE